MRDVSALTSVGASAPVTFVSKVSTAPSTRSGLWNGPCDDWTALGGRSIVATAFARSNDSPGVTDVGTVAVNAAPTSMSIDGDSAQYNGIQIVPV